MKNCIFSNNQVKFGYPINHELDDGSGGAIGLFNSILKGTNVNFTYNTANYGGAVCIVFHSKVNMQCSNFSHNTAASGSATFGSTFSTFLYKNCSLYQNQNVGRRNHTEATVIYVVQHSMINISGFKCENHRGLNCISAYNNSIVKIVNAFFSMNLGGTILIKNNRHLVTVSSSFFNNTEFEHGGAIFSVNSTLDISHSVFYHNRAKEGGSLYVMFSTADLNNCTFKNNSNAAIIIWNSTASTVKCTFESNSSPIFSGALLVHNFSFVNVSRTIFLKNSGTTGGAIGVNRSSSIVISGCYFSTNNALFSTDKNFTGGGGEGGGAIFVEGSTLKLFASRFYNNCADNMGGSVLSGNETSLLIHDTDFENNRAGSHGGAIAIYDQSYITIHGCSLTNNSVLGYVESKGGGLFARGNCTVFISNVYITESNAQEGSAIYISNFCQITMFNSSFMANIYLTIVLLSSVSSHINGCRFFNNSSPLAVSSASSANVTNTVFYYNIGHYGGVLFAEFLSNVSFHNCSFTGNTAFEGGVLFTHNSDIRLISSNFTGNNATNGRVFKISGHLFIAHCIINNNKANGDGGVGYLEETSQINISTSIFRANSAFNNGGVLFTHNSDIRLISSNFTGNNATNGGVFKISGHLFIAHCIMNNNKANGDGGVGYLEETSQINISTSIFRANSAFNNGGVLWIKRSTVNVWNSSFVHNWAGYNGGVANVEYNSTINISLTTCFGNKGTYGGVVTASKKATLFVHNSKLLQNSADDCGAALLDSASVLEISFSKTYRNNANLNGQTLCAMNYSLFISTSSLFKGNTGLIYLYNSTGYLENCTLIVNKRRKARIRSIHIFTSELNFSNTIFEQNMEQHGIGIESGSSITSFINRLRTYRCLMKHGSIMLKSNVTNFKQIAIKEHFLEEYPAGNLATEETQFASSELLSLDVFFHVPNQYN